MRAKFILISFGFLLFSTSCDFSSDHEHPMVKDYFENLRTEKIQSDPSVEWRNFGPGMSGYCEEFWCHPTDTNVMFMGPDMHVSYGTWDNGNSWQSLKDSDGLGQEMKRVLDIEFSLQDPDYGMAIDWNGWAYETTNRGRTWEKTAVLGGDHKELGIDADGKNSFQDGWYYEQLGKRHSELAVDPTNANVWYVGAGDFWNVKSNHKSAANPHGIFFKYADYGYILKTQDKGKSWSRITNGLPEKTDVAKIIVNPNHNDSVIMATNYGVMISGDGGLSWKNSSSGLPNNLPRDLTSWYNVETNQFELFLIEQTVYEDEGNTVACKGGVFKSTDGGLSWKNITGNLSIDLTSVNNPPTLERYFRTIAYWFGMSRDEAKSKFTRLPEEALPVFNRIAINPLDNNEIYITYNKKHDLTFGPGDVWQTLDGGETWVACARYGEYWNSDKDTGYWNNKGNPVGSNLEFAHLQTYMDGWSGNSGNRFLTINARGDVFIQVDQQTLKSVDKGITWKQIDDYETSPNSNKWIGRGGSNLPGRFMQHETGIPGRRLLCSGEHGLWQTTDLDGWNDPQAVVVEQIEGQVHDHSGNHGAHSISTVAAHPTDPNTIYILSWRQEHRGKLRRTNDGGKTWENIATIFDADNPIWTGVAPQNSLVIDPDNPDNMYFCATHDKVSEIGTGPGPKLIKGGYGFYRSFDGGYTWELSNHGIHEDASVRRIILHPDNPHIIYAALNDDDGGLFRTDEQGNSWKRMQIPSVIKAVNNVFIDRNNKHLFICTGRRDGTYEEGGVWRSTDDGKSWVNIFKAPFVWQVESSPVDPKLIVISVAGQSVDRENPFMNPGIYLSRNEGETWNKINRNLGQPDKIVDVKPDPYNENVLWCASWGCGWYVAYLNGTTAGWMSSL